MSLIAVFKTARCLPTLLGFGAAFRQVSHFSSTTHPRKMHVNNPSASAAFHTANGYLDSTFTTGSTPDHFIPPPDKPEYHPYRLPDSQSTGGEDWQDGLELDTATLLAQQQPAPLRFLVLYGSLRQTSYSRLLAFEMARLLEVSKAEETYSKS